MKKEEAIERFENVKANALVQKASGVSEYWQNEINGTIEAIDLAIESLLADEEKENGTFFNRDNCNFNCNDSNRTLVDVVRCKDCRFAEHGTMIDLEEAEKTPRHYLDWIKCHNYDIHKGVRFVEEDDFCSWAERRKP